MKLLMRLIEDWNGRQGETWLFPDVFPRVNGSARSAAPVVLSLATTVKSLGFGNTKSCS